MKSEMRLTLARLPYAEKLRRVAELIELSRRLKSAQSVRTGDRVSSITRKLRESQSGGLTGP